MNPQGIYTLVSRGNTLQNQMDTIANNLANVNTTGYKEDQPAFQELFATTMGVAQESDEEPFATHEHLGPYTGVGSFFVSMADMGKNMAPGALASTNNILDFAIVSPDGFFSIDTPQGERFTRAGSFHLNQNGVLVNADGYTVNGKEGPITIRGTEVRLGDDGSIIVDGERAGGLKMVKFPFPHRLEKLGASMFVPGDPENTPRIVEDVQLAQGMLESSNVNTVREMVKMIAANRAYTTMQKALTASDEMNRQAVTLAQA
ncbi:MAG TPA: flagellar basal-body rod protein FlgF [bacterium]|jgi:flagellar basal-body rod protein FlgF